LGTARRFGGTYHVHIQLFVSVDFSIWLFLDSKEGDAVFLRNVGSRRIAWHYSPQDRTHHSDRYLKLKPVPYHRSSTEDQESGRTVSMLCMFYTCH
jgi:hypothetical protein